MRGHLSEYPIGSVDPGDIDRYVVRNDALVSRSTVGDGIWKGTTDVVTYTDHLAALAERDRQHVAALAVQAR